MKAITALIAAGTLAVGYATYRHTVKHDQQQQTSDMLKASASTPPRTTLPNLNTKPEEKPAERQTDKEPDKPVEQQKSTDSPAPETTPKEAPKKEEKKPFHFGDTSRWANSCDRGSCFRSIHATWAKLWSHAAWKL
jgi:hypothetical protein